MPIRRSVISALSALSLLSISGVAAASSHREAPAIANDPAADNTDVYAWVDGSNLVIVANYIGLELPEGGPNWAAFSSDVRYDIHVALGDSLTDELTYQFQFATAAPMNTGVPSATATASQLTPAPAGGQEFFAQLTGSGAFGQTYTVTQLTNGGTPTVVGSGLKVPGPNVGPRTNADVYKAATYDAYAATTLGMLTGTSAGAQVFAGPRDDPFSVDLGAIFDLAGLRAVTGANAPARDSIAYMNVHSIVLAVPLTVVNNGKAVTSGASNAQTAGVWASASRRKSTVRRRKGGDTSYGPWIQVSRLGLPLINEAVIGLQDKDYYNHLTPSDDLTTFGGYFLNPVIVRDAQFATFYASGGALAGCTGATPPGSDLEAGRTDIVAAININDFPTKGAHSLTTIGDILRVDLGTPGATFPNGRTLTDDVTGIELSLLLCKLAAPVPAGTAPNEYPFGTTFPYLASPTEGFASQPRPASGYLGAPGDACKTGANCDSNTCIPVVNTCQ